MTGPIRALQVAARLKYSASGLVDYCGDDRTPLVHFVVWRAGVPASEAHLYASQARELAALLLAAAADADGVPEDRNG